MKETELLSGHIQELRRGTIVLACLATLGRPHYGYALLRSLEKDGFSTDANTLYPLLRRLEKQGLLTSEWDTQEARPRKFYKVSPSGEELLEHLTREWHALDSAVRSLEQGGTP